MDLNEQERENLNNEKLLKRLYKAAQAEINQEQPVKHHEGAEESAMGGQDRAVLDMHTKNEAAMQRNQLNHDMWVRIKEHQERLRKVLVHEAKKDLYEKLVQEQAYLDKENQDRAHRMYEWEERKLVTEALKK